MLPVTICHFIKDYQHRKKIRCAAVTESQCLCLSDRTGRYALHTLLSLQPVIDLVVDLEVETENGDSKVEN